MPLTGPPTSTSRPSLLLVTAGGTITMTTGVDGIRRPASAAHVGELLAELAEVTVNMCTLAEIDSSQATPAFWEMLLATLRQQAAFHGPRPTIITHGTDTLAWTAGMLAAAGGWTTPIVLTAANTALGEDGSDAPANLTAAAAVARTAPPGVYVAFAGSPDAPGEVFAGGLVRKVRAEGQAFAGLPVRCGAVANGEYVHEANDPGWAPPSLASEVFARRILLVSCQPGLDAAPYLVALRSESRPDALVLELYACGTAPPAAIELARAATAQGVTVLACPPAPLVGDAHYASTTELYDVGAQLHLAATVETLVPVAASGPAGSVPPDAGAPPHVRSVRGR